MDLINFLNVGILVSVLTFIISWTSIFEAFRLWVAKKSDKLGDLISCPFCLSFYVASIVLYFSKFNLYIVFDFPFFDFFFNVFIIMGISGVFHAILLRTYQPIIDKKIQEIKNRIKQKV